MEMAELVKPQMPGAVEKLEETAIEDEADVESSCDALSSVSLDEQGFPSVLSRAASTATAVGTPVRGNARLLRGASTSTLLRTPDAKLSRGASTSTALRTPTKEDAKPACDVASPNYHLRLQMSPKSCFVVGCNDGMGKHMSTREQI